MGMDPHPQHMPLLLITPPHTRDTLLRNSPHNPSHTNTVFKMITLVPASKRPKAKMPMVPSKVHTVSTFPLAVFKSSPTLLITPMVSLLTSSMKVPPSTPKRNPMPPNPHTPLLLPSMPLLPNMPLPKLS